MKFRELFDPTTYITIFHQQLQLNFYIVNIIVIFVVIITEFVN
jgi:hypothetical protein